MKKSPQGRNPFAAHLLKNVFTTASACYGPFLPAKVSKVADNRKCIKPRSTKCFSKVALKLLGCSTGCSQAILSLFRPPFSLIKLCTVT